MPNPLRIFGRKRFRRSVLKTLHAALVSVLVVQSVLVGSFALTRPAVASASSLPTPPGNSGAIWTTTGACGADIQDKNHYKVGEHVFINAANFDPMTSYAWTIIGQPGQASTKPNMTVASGMMATDANGAVCFDAYTIAADDGGEFQASYNDKHDNYRVDGKNPCDDKKSLVSDSQEPKPCPDPCDDKKLSTSSTSEDGPKPCPDPCDDKKSISLSSNDEPKPCPDPCKDSLSTSSSSDDRCPKPCDDKKLTASSSSEDGPMPCPDPCKPSISATSSYPTDEHPKPGCTGTLKAEKVVDSGDAKGSDFAFTISPDPSHVGPVTPVLSNGKYIATFSNLPTNTTYSISEAPVFGYHQVSSTCSEVKVSSDNVATCVIHNAQNAPQTGRIHGFKYDTQEHPLNGWQICLSSSYDDVTTASATNRIPSNCVITGDTTKGWATGEYAFEEVPFGYYSLAETMKTGWVVVSPSYGVYQNLHLSSSHNPLERDFINRQLTANLSIDKDDDRSVVQPGQVVTYDIPVINSQQSETGAVNTIVTDTLPAHLAYVSSTVNGDAATPTINGSSIAWNLGTLAVGSTTMIRLTVQFDSTFPFGTTSVTNHVMVSTDTPETTTEDNHAMDTDTVTTSAVLGLEKTGPATVNAGDNLTYTLNWSVAGTAGVTHAMISDPFPANTTFVSQTCGTTVGTCVAANDASHITWDLGNRSQGDHGTVTVTLKTSAALASGVIISNTAQFVSEETPAVQSTVNTTVIGVTQGTPILSITKTNSVTAFTNPGQTITYTVIVKNSALATASATNVMMTDTLPTGFTFVDTGLATKVIALGTIAPGNSVTLIYDVVVSSSVSSGSYINTASAKGENTDTVSASSTVAIRVPEVLGATTEPSLTIKKTVNVTKAIASGSIISYTVTIKNTGDLAATNVVLEDTLPTGFTFLVDGSSHKIWNIGTLQPDHSRVIIYDVKISNSVKNGSYKNVAVLNADGQEAVRAEATVTIKNPQVLGLADTGAGSFDLIVLALSGLAFLVGASIVIRNQHGYRTS